MAQDAYTNTENEKSTEHNTAVMHPLQGIAVNDVMQCGVLTISPQDSVYRAIGLMVEKGISGLPVVEDRQVCGIISEKDLLKLVYEEEQIPGVIRDHMTFEITGFDIDDPLSDICECFIHNKFRRVPILYRGKLAGLISRSDLVKAFYHQYRSRNQVESDASVCIPAKDVMKGGLVTIELDTPVYDAVDLLVGQRLTGLPVVDDCYRLIGIVTDKDVLVHLATHPDSRASVSEIMTENVVSFDQNASFFDVCDCLIQNDFRRIPILRGDKLIGIISRADIMLYILKNKTTIFSRRRSHQ